MPLDTTSTSRTELIRLNQEIEAATTDRDEIQRRHDRISAPAIELQKTIANLARAKAEYDAEIVAWYEGGCPGDRPQPPGVLLSLEHAVGVLKSDIGASEHALETAAAAVDEANQRLSSLAVWKQSALYAVILEAAEQHLRDCCIPAMVESLRQLAAVESLAAELRAGGINNPEALSCARRLEQLLFETRQAVAVRSDQQSAQAFITAVAEQPHAELVAPQVEVITLEPRTIRPLEDGTKFLNRGTPEPPAEPAVHIPFLEPLPWATVEATQ